jgi:hypothetical protein
MEFSLLSCPGILQKNNRPPFTLLRAFAPSREPSPNFRFHFPRSRRNILPAMKFIAILVFVICLGPVLLRGQNLSAPTANSSVVDSSVLIPLLPAAPPGWNADRPEGTTGQSYDGKITTVSNTYAQGEADNAPTTTINIIDSANNQQFQDATKAMWKATSQSPQGFDKDVTVAGLRGFEHYSNADQTGVLWVVADGRFFVQVETTRQPVSELEAWLSRIDLKKLGALK